MTLNDETTKIIVLNLLEAEDYRKNIVILIDATFIEYSIDFFKRVIEAKMRNKDIDIDWYKKEFINDKLTSEEIAIHSGLNKKTISNMYNSASREIVIEASFEHYGQLSKMLETLVDNEDELSLTLTIRMGKVGVDLNISESLIVINTLAVKRAAIRGGAWSTAGKRVEVPLMLSLCKLYNVDDKYFHTDNKIDEGTDFSRETDFYLISPDKKEYKCEVKLMGKGNPESADAVIARDSTLFVADKLSDTNKSQLNSLGVEWIELRQKDGYKKFESILDKLQIPHSAHTDHTKESVIQSIFA